MVEPPGCRPTRRMRQRRPAFGDSVSVPSRPICSPPCWRLAARAPRSASLWVPGRKSRAWDHSCVEIDDLGGTETGSTNERWPLVKVFDLVALVLVGAVVVQIIGGVVSAAGFPSSDLPGTSSLPLSSRLFVATLWANLPTPLLLLASLAVLAIPRIVWDVPAAERRAGLAPKATIAICCVASLAAVAGLVAIGNTIWNSPHRNPSDSLNVAASLAAAAVSAVVAILSWFAVPYVEEDAETA